MSLFTDVIADYRTFEGLIPATYTSKTSGGSANYLLTDVFCSNPRIKGFGEPAVKGYMIESNDFRFVLADLAATPKAGDEITVGATTFEVNEVERRRPVDASGTYAFWYIKTARAFVDTSWSVSVDVQRATLAVNGAGAEVETFVDIAANVSAIMVFNDDAADMQPRLSIRGDKQSVNFYVAQTVSINPMDRIEYGSRFYRITSIQDEGKLSRLKRLIAEIYP